jgi:uncharacterized protein (DUF1697 family)
VEGRRALALHHKYRKHQPVPTSGTRPKSFFHARSCERSPVNLSTNVLYLTDEDTLPFRLVSARSWLRYNEASMKKYVALLRGINVGGKNLIKMAALKACFETLGFKIVTTYIQSGNVLFGADESDQAKLTSRIEEALSRTFNYQSRVVVRSQKQLKGIVVHAPKGFGSDPVTYRYDVLFLKEPLTATEAMKSITAKEGVDQAVAGKGALYFTRLISKASQSHLTRIITLPVYQNMTIRNWNTTTKLLGLMEAVSD